MEKFGATKYAVLCKASSEKDTETMHKGTGFVRFLNKEDADNLLTMSASLEAELDKEWAVKKDAAKMKKVKGEEKATIGG